MKNMSKLSDMRGRERGSVAIVIAFSLTALLGMAVLAIDFGYLYAKRRGLQADADTTLKLSIPTYMSSGLSAGQGKATTVGQSLGYTGAGDTISASEDTANNLYTVTIRRIYPTFIGGVFGLAGKTASGTAVGKITPGVGGAGLQALNGAVCGVMPTWGVGFTIQGDVTTSFTINGSIESGTEVSLQTGSGSITGSVKTDCPTPLVTGGGNFNAANATVTGGQITIASGGGIVTDSIGLTAAQLAPFCTNGSLTTAAVPVWNWTPGAGCDTPDDEIYCSMSNMNISPPGLGKTICPGTKATFISLGQLTFGADNGINLLPSTRPTLNATAAKLVAVSFANAGAATCGTQDVFFGASKAFALGDATHDAYVYAPGGCVGAGGGALGFTSYGKIVAQNIDFQPTTGSSWVFNASGGGGGGGTWKLYK